MKYDTFSTQDGGSDMLLDEILSYADNFCMEKYHIEAGLLNHGDRTCKYFTTQLNIMGDMCRSILAKLETLK